MYHVNLTWSVFGEERWNWASNPLATHVGEPRGRARKEEYPPTEWVNEGCVTFTSSV